MTEFLTAALKLAADGFHVFPIRPQSKLPAIKRFPELATRDPETIKAWWEKRPNANIGISTSRFGDDERLIAADVDIKNGKDGFATVFKLELTGKEFPQTYSQETPTKGAHYVYRTKRKLRQGAGTLGTGIDTRATGGFIVAAGSEVGGKLYVANDLPVAPAPEWLEQDLGEASDPPKVPAVGGEDTGRPVNRSIHYLVHEAVPAVEGASGDTQTYKTAARLKDFGVSAAKACELMAEHYNPRCSPPWDADELLEKVRNGYAYGQNAVGSADPAKQFDPIPTTDAPASVEAPAAKVLPFKAFADIEPDIERPALVKGWLDQGGFSLPYGPFGSAKTLTFLHLDLHVAMGWEWMGCKVQQGAVVHFALEGGDGIDRRVKALKIKYGLEGKDIPLYIVKAPINLCKNTNAGSDLVIDTIREIEKAAGQRVVLCVIDTVRRAMGGSDENDSAAVGAFTAHVDRIRHAIGCHVAAIHHTGKDASKGARGSSAFGGNVDTMIFIENGKMSIPDGDRGKQRDGKTGGAIGFKVVEVELGKDADGDVVTSAVIEPAPLPSSSRPAFKSGSGPDRVLRLMFEAEEKGQKVSPQPGRLNLHQGARVFKRELIREMFLAEKLDYLDESDRNSVSVTKRQRRTLRESFRQATDDLKRAGRVDFDKEYLWFS